MASFGYIWSILLADFQVESRRWLRFCSIDVGGGKRWMVLMADGHSYSWLVFYIITLG
jgi:hypothetical protein